MPSEKECYKIVDNKTSNIIVCDYIINHKNYYMYGVLKNPLITFDQKYFFKTLGNKNYSCLPANESEICKLNIPSNYNIVLWRDCKNEDMFDVAREYDINELDPECVEVVTLLNQIPNIRTVGSCCGHGLMQFYVDIAFRNFLTIKMITKYIYKNKQKNILKLSTVYTLDGDENSNEVIFRLKTIDKGEKAYQVINDFCKYLKKAKTIGIE